MTSPVAGLDDDEGFCRDVDRVCWRFGKDPFLGGPEGKEDGLDILEVPSRGQTDGVVVGQDEPAREQGEYHEIQKSPGMRETAIAFLRIPPEEATP